MNAIAVWCGLQLAALRDVHPDWFPELPDELILAARNTQQGRNWLANKLAIRSVLFRYLTMPRPADLELDDAELERAMALPDMPEWLFRSREQWQPLMLGLGAAASAPTIRATVLREQVLSLRRVLGDLAYERCLISNDELEFSDPLRGRDEQPDWPAKPESVRNHLLRLGALELYHWLTRLHPIAAERCRFAFSQRWLLVDVPAKLTGVAVARCMAEWDTTAEKPQSVDHANAGQGSIDRASIDLAGIEHGTNEFKSIELKSIEQGRLV